MILSLVRVLQRHHHAKHRHAPTVAARAPVNGKIDAHAQPKKPAAAPAGLSADAFTRKNRQPNNTEVSLSLRYLLWPHKLVRVLLCVMLVHFHSL